MLRRENIRYEKGLDAGITNLDEYQYDPAKPFDYMFYLATTQEQAAGAEHRWWQVNFENKTNMAIMGVVHISQYLDDDHTVAASSYDHFASCGSVVSFAGANVDNGNKGGGKGTGKQKGQLAIKPPAPALAIKDDFQWGKPGPTQATPGAKKEACQRYNTKSCPGDSKKG